MLHRAAFRMGFDIVPASRCRLSAEAGRGEDLQSCTTNVPSYGFVGLQPRRLKRNPSISIIVVATSRWPGLGVAEFRERRTSLPSPTVSMASPIPNGLRGFHRWHRRCRSAAAGRRLCCRFLYVAEGGSVAAAVQRPRLVDGG